MKAVFSYIKWVLFAVSVYLTHEYCSEYWIAGPLFGVVSLLFLNALNRRDALRAGFFLTGSTCTYALVVWISEQKWKDSETYLGIFVEPLSVAVAAGSFLMALLLHFTFLHSFSKGVRLACRLIILWYAVYSLAWLDDRCEMPININYLFIAIGLWQWVFVKHLSRPGDVLKRSQDV